MNAVLFRRDIEVSVAVFADCSSDAWNRFRASGVTVSTLRDAIVAALTAAVAGSVTAGPVEVTPRTGADCTLSARVTFRPGRDVPRDELDRAILQWLNLGAPQGATWTEHTSANAYLGAGAVALPLAPLLAPVAGIAAVVGLVSDDARASVSAQWRRVAGMVIDEGSIRQGSSREPVGASASAVGRAATVATGGAVQSTDPTRDGQTPAERAADSVPGVQPPAWVLPLVIVGGVVVGVAVLGYGARGIAQVMRES